MAHLNWHDKRIVCWTSQSNPDYKVYLTETGWLLSTSGPRGGKCKVLARPAQAEIKGHWFQLLNAKYNRTNL